MSFNRGKHRFVLCAEPKKPKEKDEKDWKPRMYSMGIRLFLA